MAGSDSKFVGSIPEKYDAYLGPFLFEPYAADFVRRLALHEGDPGRIECGVGVHDGKLLARIGHDLPPLRGVMHAAGVLDDGGLLQQDPARFAAVLGPKIEGAIAFLEGGGREVLITQPELLEAALEGKEGTRIRS